MEMIIALSVFLAFIGVIVFIDRWHARHPRKSH